MTDDECQPVTVSRRISAPAHDIFRVLADPARHVELDGSGMLRGAVTDRSMTPVVGDVFVMQMYYSELGAYEMNNHIVEYEVRPAGSGGNPSRAGGIRTNSAGRGARWGHRWRFDDLVEDGPDATIVTEIYDCSRIPSEGSAFGMDGGRV